MWRKNRVAPSCCQLGWPLGIDGRSRAPTAHGPGPACFADRKPNPAVVVPREEAVAGESITRALQAVETPRGTADAGRHEQLRLGARRMVKLREGLKHFRATLLSRYKERVAGKQPVGV